MFIDAVLSWHIYSIYTHHIIIVILFVSLNYLQINEDLVGEVTFLAQTGPFTIPIQCTTKKCDVSIF